VYWYAHFSKVFQILKNEKKKKKHKGSEIIPENEILIK
jgi:hypothetical protein